MLTHCGPAGQVKYAPASADSLQPVSATYDLQPHPATPPRFPLAITVTLARNPGGDLELAYRLRGDQRQLRLPASANPGPADGLWQHTCCEAFLGLADGAYREFNFAPSGQWAVYDFSAYRQRGAAAPAVAPRLAVAAGPDELRLTVCLPAALIPTDAGPLGLTVVVEEADGAKSYWALTHAVPQPDFHRRESFLAALPA